MSFKEKNHQIFTVGLTGGIGAGKSTVGRVFETLGIPRFDADKYAHHIYRNDENVRTQVVEKFSSEVAVFNLGGEIIDIDRAKLGAIVFENEEALQFLNDLVHPAVRLGFENWLAKIPRNIPYVIREAAILFESGSEKGCDCVINVSADEGVRIKRAMNRDGISGSNVRNRMSRQFSDTQRANRSDFTIFNNPNDKLLTQIINIHEVILARSNEG